jgi:hypothetical protein
LGSPLTLGGGNHPIPSLEITNIDELSCGHAAGLPALLIDLVLDLSLDRGPLESTAEHA